ncbi:MAG: hypothetical protein M3Q37_04905 [Gemmatimonadota bacterium]|nr:hypothetical protein [Gemmatimonadota bacterium]
MTKLRAGILSITMVATTLSPIGENWRPRPKDNFPLSHYPMFSAKRSDSVRITYLLAADSSGNWSPVSYRHVGPGGLNQVRRQIAAIVRRGDPKWLCRTVAAKVARDAKHLQEAFTLRVVTGSYRLSDYLEGTRVPFAEREHASCSVRRGRG